MSRKSLILIIIGLFLIAGAGLYWFLTRPSASDTTENTPPNNTLLLGGDIENRPPSPGSTTTPIFTPEKARGGITELTQLTASKIAGATVLEQGSTTLVRFAESGTGHLYEINLNSGETRRLTNTTIPKVTEAVWVEKGKGVLLRYVGDGSEIKTFYGKVPPASATTTEQPLTGNFLPDNITSLVALPDSVSIFYLVDTGSGAEGYTSNTNGSSNARVFSSAMRLWQAREADKDTVSLYPNASWETSGIVAIVNVRSKKTEYLLGNLSGLTAALNPKRDIVIFSKREGSTLSLNSLSRATNEELSLTPSALPEKCVWSRTANALLYCAVSQELLGQGLPDSWYRGSVSFTDDIWKLDTSTGASGLVASISSKAVIDATHLFLDQRESYLFFTNRKDRTLWVLPLQP